jgi:tRNA A-37 threonylcarbamoyl transferase component Bud32
METDPTQVSVTGEKHPSLAELRDPSHPQVSQHLAACSMCRSIVSGNEANEAPIPLDLPKGLVSEQAFRWPGDPIARGGMAQIFAGEDKRLGRTVILKAPRDGDDLPAGIADLFQRRVTAEARILAKLQHPAIVTIYELGKASVGWPFCVLQRVEGTSLRDLLDDLADREFSDGKLHTRERLELLSSLTGIAEALAYAHERRVVHRDCTPNNILLGKRGEATLIDWGIARDLDAPGVGGTDPTLADDEPSKSGRMVTISAGTPPYLPLEQSQGRSAHPSFDVYSFGVTLYEVVSGRTPFEWKNVDGAGARTRQLEQFIEWLRSDDVAPPAMPRDPELSGIIAKAMAREPRDRFTADELLRALKQYLTGDLVFSHRYSLTGRMARWASRHKAITVAISLVLVFGIGGALFWQRQAKQQAELREAATAAQADAMDKDRQADQATREAADAKARAEQAQREGKDADALRVEADKKRKAADAMRRSAQDAASRAKDNADDAIKRYQAAMKDKDEADAERDAAVRNQGEAEKARDVANAGRVNAEHERDNSNAARTAAEKERDTAKTAATQAETDRDAARAAADKERDTARAAQSTAEKDRDAAVSARAAAEKERDDLRRRIRELEGGGGGGPRRPPPDNGGSRPPDGDAPITTPSP